MIDLSKHAKNQKVNNPKNKTYKKAVTSNFDGVSFDYINLSSHLLRITIKVDQKIVKTAYHETVEQHKKDINPLGFSADNIPSEYIEEKHGKEIFDKVKILLFKYIVSDYLNYKIRSLHVYDTNHPRLIEMIESKNFNLKYIFDVSIADKIKLKEWKHFIFRPPKRKKYKDLDKQVENFIKQESSPHKKQKPTIIEQGDWVTFRATILNSENSPIWKDKSVDFCIKIGQKEFVNPFQKLFISKKEGNSFITNNMPLEQDSLLDGQCNNYKFLIYIKSITKGKNFSIDLFKSTFKLKSKQEVHTKLIEAFSFKDDVSQRYSTIEDLFHLLLSKHRFEVPTHISIRRQGEILTILKKKPDYQVYKSQNEFNKNIALLADQQLKEEILIDQISYAEEIFADEHDIQNYLHLLSHKRLREFIHFRSLYEEIEKCNLPINISTLSKIVCREKTLNYIIHTLTK